MESFRFQTAPSSPVSRGIMSRRRKTTKSLAVPNRSSPGLAPTFSLWSRIQQNTPLREGGGLLNSKTANRPTRRCIKRAFPVTCLSKLATTSSPVTHQRHKRSSRRLIGGIMSNPATSSLVEREAELHEQTVVVIGGSAGIGLETARRARAARGNVILTARNSGPLQRAANEVGALSTAAFDATDFERLGSFFDQLRTPIDQVLVTGPGPYYATLAEFDFDKARRNLEAHVLLPLHVARNGAGKVRAGGTLLFMSGTARRHPAAGFALLSALTCGAP